jgi:hypothetical protein
MCVKIMKHMQHKYKQNNEIHDMLDLDGLGYD